MLYTAHWASQRSEDWVDDHHSEIGLYPYKPTHANHPITKWIRQCQSNYLYACDMGLSLCSEYTRRYGRIHVVQARLEWLINYEPPSYCQEPIKAFLADKNIPPGCTPIPLAMPAIYHNKNAILAYRNYYLGDKKHIAQKNDTIPTFE